MVGRLKRNDVPDMMVKERGRGKSLQQVLADGRSTGHFKLQGRCLQEARHGDNALFFRIAGGFVLIADIYAKKLDYKMMPQAPALTSVSF